MGNDRAADRLVDVHALQVVLVDEAVERRRQHRQVGLVAIKRIGTAEGNADTSDHADSPQCLFHLKLPATPARGGAQQLCPRRRRAQATAVRRSGATLDFCSLALKCSGPPRNGAKPVPKITPASTRSALSTIFSSRQRSHSRINGSTSSRPSRSSSKAS